MRRVIELLMILSLAGCAAQPASYVSAPVVPDGPAPMRRPAAVMPRVPASAPGGSPGVAGRLDNIDHDLQSLRTWLDSDPQR